MTRRRVVASAGLPSETEFSRALLEGINAPPHMTRVWRQNTGKHEVRAKDGGSKGWIEGAPKGAADLSGIYGGVGPGRGLRLEVEVKVTAPHTKQQKVRQRMMRLWGAVCVLVRWERGLGLEENVARGVRLVDEAIAARVHGRDVEHG